MTAILSAVLEGELTDKDNVAEWIMQRADVMPRINPRILDADRDIAGSHSRYLDLTDIGGRYSPRNLNEFETLSDRQQNEYLMSSMKYMRRTMGERLFLVLPLRLDSSSGEHIRSLSAWIVADLESVDGRQLVYEAIKHLKHSHNMRIGLVHNPRDLSLARGKHSISRVVQVKSCLKAQSTFIFLQGALWALTEMQAKQFVTKLAKEEFAVPFTKGDMTIDDLAVHEMNVDKFKKELAMMEPEFLNMDSSYCRRVLGLEPGQRAIVINGQVDFGGKTS